MFENVMKAVGVLQALLTPTIGVVTTYIAWRQYHDAKVKLALDRYEKRLRVYQAVRKYISDIVGTRKLKTEDIRQLRIDSSEAAFLFERDIPKYIEELVRHGANLGYASDSYRDINAPAPTPAGYDHGEVCRIINDETLWMNEQFDVAERKFAKYLNIA